MHVFTEEEIGLKVPQRTIRIWLDREGKYILGQGKGLMKDIHLEKYKQCLGESESSNLATAEFMEISR